LVQAKSWVERFDMGDDESGERLFVYAVQNGRAKDLADVLHQIFEPDSAVREAPRARLAPNTVPVELATPEGEAAAPAAVRPRLAAAAAGMSVTRQGRVRVIADEVNNALVIMATPRDYRAVEAALRKLDIVPLQVLIEATIAEVTLNDTLRYGVQWFLSKEGHGLTLSEIATGAVSSAFPGFSYLYSGRSNLRTVLNALESVTDVKVISSPQLMVLDNQTAHLQVGDQVPVAVQQSVSVTNPDAPTVNTIEFRDTGVILNVTPRVNAGGLVTMEIEQEVSDVTNTVTSGIDSPTISQRSIKSTVAVQSGDTIALGGLISDSKTATQSGIPFLMDIPILGHLFRTDSFTDSRTELLVLITPRVVRDPQEARDVTEELKRRMRALGPLESKVR
jgi:general secretion pathway protein D